MKKWIGLLMLCVFTLNTVIAVDIPAEYQSLIPTGSGSGMSGVDTSQFTSALAEISAGITNLETAISKAKANGTDTTKAQGILDQAKGMYTEANTALNNQQYEQVGTLLQSLEALNLEQAIKDAGVTMPSRDELSSMLGQIEDGIKQMQYVAGKAQIVGGNSTEINTFYNELKTFYDKALAAVDSGTDTDVQNVLLELESMNIESRANELSSGLNQKESISAGLIQINKSVAFGEKIIVQMKAAGKDTKDMETFVTNVKAMVIKVNDALAINDMQTAGELMIQMEALPWEKTYQTNLKVLQENSIKEALTQGINSVKNGLKASEGPLLTLTNAKVDTTDMTNFINKIKNLLKEAEDLYAASKWDECGVVLDRIGKLGQIVEDSMNQFESLLKDTNNFTFLGEDAGTAIPTRFMTIFSSKASTSFEDALKDDGNAFETKLSIMQEAPEIISTMFESGSDVDLDTIFNKILLAPEQYRETLITARNTLNDKVNILNTKITSVLDAKKISSAKKLELENLKKNVEGYNFGEKSADDMAQEIEDFMVASLADDATKVDLEAKITELKTKYEAEIKAAIIEKYQNGAIPFLDTDDTQWYTTYVDGVKDDGIVSGYKDSTGKLTGEFKPANNVTVAEFLKIALEAAGKGQSSGEPINKNAANHWAKGYFKKGEELGLSLVKDGKVDPNRPATRAEVVQLFMEVFNIKPDTSGQPSFTDIANSPLKGYIEEAKDLGIVSGNPDGTFKPDSFINRAEVSKIVTNSMNILK